MRFLLFFFVLAIVACNHEAKYEETEHLKLKKYVELDVERYDYLDLLLTYLTDTNNLIINESDMIARLSDSLEYYIDNGKIEVSEKVDSVQELIYMQINYETNKEIEIWECYGFKGDVDIFMNLADQIMIEGYVLGDSLTLEQLIRRQCLDSNLSPRPYFSSEIINSNQFGEVRRPRLDYSIFLEYKADSLKALSHFKFIYRELEQVIKNLREDKAQLMFHKHYHELSWQEKYFLINYFKYQLHTSQSLKPLPPPPPIVFKVVSH